MTQRSKSMVLVAKEVDGVEMGVLADGTPFLTGRGLAKACGVAPSTIINQAQAWKSGKRDNALAQLLVETGYDEESLYIAVDGGGQRFNAYTDSVATIVIEYYALEANNAKAKQVFRVFAREGLREFIYKATGYDPRAVLPPAWRNYHDRILLTSFPVGFFSVFREMADFILRALQAGLTFDNENVVDISVGATWANHWRDANLEAKYGAREKHVHNYPDDYPQAASNPQDIWVYPVEALGSFRRWLDEVYIPEKFPAYLNGKVKQRVLARAAANMLLAAVTPATLTSGEDDPPF